MICCNLDCDDNLVFPKPWLISSKEVNFLTKEFTMLKKTFFSCKIQIKTTTTIGLKNELKYSPMSDSNTCIAEPSLEVLPLRIIQ